MREAFGALLSILHRAPNEDSEKSALYAYLILYFCRALAQFSFSTRSDLKFAYGIGLWSVSVP